MPHQQAVSNPFALMMDPDAVYQAVQRSERLRQLKRRICRPLDKPLIARVATDADEFDQEVVDTMSAPDEFDNDFDSISAPMDLDQAIVAMRDPDEA